MLSRNESSFEALVSRNPPRTLKSLKRDETLEEDLCKAMIAQLTWKMSAVCSRFVCGAKEITNDRSEKERHKNLRKISFSLLNGTLFAVFSRLHATFAQNSFHVLTSSL